jgi:hypothetical protein
MNFCEQCGQRLNPNGQFCEECGAEIPSFERGLGGRIPRTTTDCLIVFNGKVRSQEWSAPDFRAFRQSLETYATRRNEQTGLEYDILDLASLGLGLTPNFKDTLEILRFAAMAKKPRYLFIIGGEGDIPMARFTDLTGHDNDIASDVGYSLLSSNDLGSTMADTSFRPDLLVGRLPIATNGHLQNLQNYLSNVSDCHRWPAQSNRKTIGVSCLKWEAASTEVANKLGAGSVQTSPTLTHDDLESHLRTSSPECLYFNVHGSDSEPSWIGEGDGKLSGNPVVARPESFAGLRNINVIATEACYGARFSNLTTEESALMSALSNKTIAFFGSTRIAYGPHEPPNWGADTVVGEFLRPLCGPNQWNSLGQSAGEILAKCKNRLQSDFCSSAANAAMLRKTFLSFNLFGDPTVFFSPRVQSKSHDDSRKEPPFELESRIDQMHAQRLSNLSCRIEIGTQKLRASIRDKINQQVTSAFPTFAGVEPQERNFVDLAGPGSFLLTYLSEGWRGFYRSLVVACSQNGEMDRIYSFK